MQLVSIGIGNGTPRDGGFEVVDLGAEDGGNFAREREGGERGFDPIGKDIVLTLLADTIDVGLARDEVAECMGMGIHRDGRRPLMVSRESVRDFVVMVVAPPRNIGSGGGRGGIEMGGDGTSDAAEGLDPDMPDMDFVVATDHGRFAIESEAHLVVGEL